jgi:PD-(D/E)XK nuclease superfamily
LIIIGFKLINADFKYKLKDIKIDSNIYDWHDLRNLNYISIMLQTGYLTFKKALGISSYIVNYPNKEVETSFSQMLLGGYMHQHPSMMSTTVLDIQEALEENDVEKMIEILKDLFKAVPHQFFSESTEKTDKHGNKTTVNKGVNENFYHGIIYLLFTILGIRMQVEVSTQEGRIDAVVETNTHIYIFEFKKNRKADVAIQQMKDKNYAGHYSLSKKQIVLVGVSFTMQKRGISHHLIQSI